MNIKNNVDVYEMTAARDNRLQTQTSLINETGLPLISFTLNIPGSEKNNSIFKKIHDSGISEIESLFSASIKKALNRDLKTGLEAYFSIDLDPYSIKEKTIEIEEKHKLGRIFDIDVINPNLKSISRIEVNKESRKCLLCNNPASICSRNRSHTVPELIKKIEEIFHS
ncbi:MAG: citrate lyase holo-[acyl-carrier protein] synthase [Deltaproteobacteria bacterium]|nr:citrate lyase holo-[acyl-carrier protein] synthase [Deltaproteobacteria bacterium]